MYSFHEKGMGVQDTSIQQSSVCPSINEQPLAASLNEDKKRPMLAGFGTIG